MIPGSEKDHPSFIRSFGYAIEGFVTAVRTERSKSGDGHAWRPEPLYSAIYSSRSTPCERRSERYVFIPLALQIAGAFTWSVIPLPQLFPPSAATVIPTSFIPVLPSGEPLAADTVLGGALAANGALTWAGIAVAALTFVLITAVSAAWFAQSEEVR